MFYDLITGFCNCVLFCRGWCKWHQRLHYQELQLLTQVQRSDDAQDFVFRSYYIMWLKGGCEHFRGLP